MKTCPVCQASAKTIGQWLVAFDPTNLACSSCGAELRLTRQAWWILGVMLVVLLAAAGTAYSQGGYWSALLVLVGVGLVFELLTYFIIELEARSNASERPAPSVPQRDAPTLVWARRVLVAAGLGALVCEVLSWRMSGDVGELVSGVAFAILGAALAGALVRPRRRNWWAVAVITGVITVLMALVLAVWSDVVVAIFTDETVGDELAERGQNVWDVSALAVFGVGASVAFALITTALARRVDAAGGE